MEISQLLGAAKDTMTVRRVYSEPYEKDGVAVILAARVGGGGGGGTNHDEKGRESEGGGFGMGGQPAGAYVIRDGNVSWRPAVDPNRMLAVVGLVLVVHLLTRVRRARVLARSAGR